MPDSSLRACGNDGMRDGFFLLLFSRPRPCQRHDPALIPPPSAGTHAVAWRMHALVAQGTEHRIPDPGVARSNRVRGASGPSPSGRASRPQREGRGFEPRRLHDMRHAAACKRRHSEERRHVKTARPRDGIRRQRPPAGRARDGGAGRPVRGPARADVVQRQHACFPSRRPRVRTPSSALSGKPKQWI